MLLRGNRIVLIHEDDETEFAIPSDYWMIWDRNGRLLRRCDVYILQCTQAKQKNANFSPADLAEAEDYWGSHDRWVPWQFYLPTGPWKKVARLARIGYRRGRTGNWMHPGPSEPPLAEPVTLYESAGQGWRIRMPNDCVLDDRGFIYPLPDDRLGIRLGFIVRRGNATAILQRIYPYRENPDDDGKSSDAERR